MGVHKRDMTGCTMVAITLKSGYKYLQNVEAGILHIEYRYEMKTVK